MRRFDEQSCEEERQLTKRSDDDGADGSSDERLVGETSSW